MEHISGASAEAQAESVRDFASVSDDHWFGLSVPNCLAPARPSEIRAHDHPKRACSPSHRDWRCLGAVLARAWQGCGRASPLCDRHHRLSRETNPRWPRWLKGPVQSQGDVYAQIFAIRQNDQAAQRAI